ncbi:hypothetical protein BN990_03314 [Virgibacillus salexigens]|uniref:Uncharacterized protein n=1 Tax=Virgibacillus massiliensis TaxID=1462526 RepID=A0A024QFL6_9BACI|nr:hypothetical protein BN990_03314 [Virgibacillus massiliensis]
MKVYPIPEKQHVTFGITGMTCAACSTRIEKALNEKSEFLMHR